MDGNIKMKTYKPEKLFVVNHESNTIYNDVVQFMAENRTEAIKQYSQYPKQDATIIVQGSDGKIIMRKGDLAFIG